MSTRSVITVIDQHDTFHVYRHCDGYPDGKCGVVAELAQALPYAWKLPRFEAMDFAAAIIAAWKRKGEGISQGGNIYCTRGYDAHRDLEFRYEVTAKDGGLYVKVFRVSGSEGDEYALDFEGPLGMAVEHYAAK